LKKALHERRNARELEQSYTSLPDFPPRNAGHLVQDNVRYVDFPWGQGVFYLCAFTQGPGNFPNNDELIYLFQGLSRACPEREHFLKGVTTAAFSASWHPNI
jgi:hypothetical protein